MSERLYYLVRRGTNLRATGFDKRPLVVTEDAGDCAVRHYDRIVPLAEAGPLELVPVDEYHHRYHTPQVKAKSRAGYAASHRRTTPAHAPDPHEDPDEDPDEDEEGVGA